MARKKLISDKSQIIDLAQRLIESEGIEAITMIRLSKEMGVSSMTLYNYVQNAEDVLREVLIRTFSTLYERIYSIMNGLTHSGLSGIEAYAKSYAIALFDLATEHRDICIYLIGDGYTSYYNNAELRHFYNPFASFLLAGSSAKSQNELKDAFHLFECVTFSLIREYAVGSRSITRDEFIRLIDVFIMKVFPR